MLKEFLEEYSRKWPKSHWETIPDQKGQSRRRPGTQL